MARTTAKRPARSSGRAIRSTIFNDKVDYGVFTEEFDETTTAEELCDEAELDRLRAFLDKQLAHFAGRSRPSGQPVAAPPHGAAEPVLGI